MKHRIIIILSMLTMGFLPSLAEGIYWGVALLSHQGKQTAYAADNVQAAVDDAVEGDTIHFAPGNYKEITLNKKVYLQNIGEGVLAVYLQLPDNPTIESSLFIGNNFNLRSRCNLQSIYFSNFSGFFEVPVEYSVGTVIFDKCDIWYINFDCFNVGKLQANNCYVGNFFNGTTTTTESTFTHCEISVGDFSIIKATFNDCTLYNYNVDTLTVDNCKFNYCVYDPDKYNFGENTTVSNSYIMNQDEWNDSKENLIAQGFFGADETVVGRHGGTNPYDGYLISRDYPDIWKSGELKMKGKTIIGSWTVNPTR